MVEDLKQSGNPEKGRILKASIFKRYQQGSISLYITTGPPCCVKLLFFQEGDQGSILTLLCERMALDLEGKTSR
uniref:Uncharacterized protein n=1 Tax=Nelumbo nucifera TaxID=4432 RepID=A0A822ZK17_NELNU|nr:TPA_asm: hypothetical protein HUJ06_001586 [Nelumbo nucifera]